jgi:peptidoglycan/LPS O-acetylase OafA/YrhL
MTTKRRHVYEADVVRVLTFACVIAVHTISHTNSASDVPANGFEMLLHFTREAFFCLTGFVLLHGSIGRPILVTAFWRKRIAAVGVPYVAWTLVYTGIQATATFNSWSYQLGRVGTNLLYGTAWYHLYFLLVSMQIYLLFPLIAALVRRTAGHHAALLGISGLIQLVILSVQMYNPPRDGVLGWFTAHEDALLTSYQFYVLAGAVAAFHLDQLRVFVTAHRRAILAGILVTAVVAEAWYLIAEHQGRIAFGAASVLQPIMLPWSLAAVLGLFILGGIYSERRQAGSRTDRALTIGSDRSFGVFLVHPAVLWLLLQGQSHWIPAWHGLTLTVVAYILVVAGSLAVTEVFRRSPLSLPLTGRHRLSPAVVTAQPAAHGEEINHVHKHPDTPGAPVQAPHEGPHDGDRRWAADPLLHRRGVELQWPDRRDEARLGNLAGDR